uniref:Uncharacterized protein n=1 Tax=Anguilla anguilla TaxID=7936 RepID=A0A0E9XMN2_ANGAN
MVLLQHKYCFKLFFFQVMLWLFVLLLYSHLNCSCNINYFFISFPFQQCYS